MCVCLCGYVCVSVCVCVCGCGCWCGCTYVCASLFVSNHPDTLSLSTALDAHQRWKLVLYILLKFAISYIVIEFIASSQVSNAVHIDLVRNMSCV